MDQAGHVIPAAQIEREECVAQIVGELFHLIGQRMRFHQRHALDVVAAASPSHGQGVEQIAPPERFFGRFGSWECRTERIAAAIGQFTLDRSMSASRTSDADMFFALDHASLAQVQSARAERHYCVRG